jgi:hypothetical protein
MRWQWGVSGGRIGDCGDQGDKVDAAVVTKAERLKGGADEGGLDSGERCRQAVAAYFLHLGWWQPRHNIVVSVMVSSNCCIGSTGCCWEMTEDSVGSLQQN